MNRIARSNPVVIGSGSLLIRREPHAVEYQVASPDGLRSGKGWVSGDLETVKLAFSAGRVKLTLEDGAVLSVLFVGHTSGGDTAYFDIERG